MTTVLYVVGAFLVVAGVTLANPWLLLVLAGAALVRAGQVRST